MSVKVCRRTGKVGYRSIGEARAAAADAVLKGDSMARTYERRKRETSAFKCPHCPRWHLTSQRQFGDTGVNFDDLMGEEGAA